MRRAAVLIAGLLACRYNLDKDNTDAAQLGVCMDGTSPACMASGSASDLASIQANIFNANCTFSGCHDGGNTLAGKLDLRDSHAHASLVGVASQLEPTRKLVVAGNPQQSYLEVMIGEIKPADADPPAGMIRADVGLMPMNSGGQLLCCQKLGAIKRWIMAGAMP